MPILIQIVLDVLYIHVIRRIRFYTALLIFCVLCIPGALLFLPAPGFPSGQIVTIESDASFSATADMLRERGILSSETVFKILARITGTDTKLHAGRYLFEKPVGVAEVLYRLSQGTSGIEARRITFPEGSTVREMADILAASMPGFSKETFIQEAKPYEGYLFPDTYAFYIDASPEEIIVRMRSRFDEVWSSLPPCQGVTLTSVCEESQDRVVTMASLLEKETRLGPDRAIVSGILWKRIATGMPLQVDAVFGYIHNRDTFHPSFKDLEVDSPYNTYKHKDLPPTPIGNPGKDALMAALYPTASPYLYYLTGSDGLMYYAKDFEGHKQNRIRYLR